MDYSKHYNSLIIRAKTRIIDGYVEKHHIIPKCLGGTDDISNIVILTPEEHFLAHQLLVKIYPENKSIIFAARMMCVGSDNHKRNNKLYAWLKRRYYASRIGEKRKPYIMKKPRKVREKETKPRKKRILTAQHRAKISEANRRRKHSPETKEKIRQSNIATKSLKKQINL